MSLASDYRKGFAAALCRRLGTEWRVVRGVQLERVRAEGVDQLRVAGPSASSPLLSITFEFGRRYDTLTALIAKSGADTMRVPVMRNSLNRASMRALPRPGPGKCQWAVNADRPVPAGVLDEVENFVDAVVEPFFAHFTRMEEARDALAAGPGNPWCLPPAGDTASMVALLDLALGARRSSS